MAHLSPEYLEQVAKHTADIYADATSSMIRLVARRLASGMDDGDDWATQKLLEMLRLRADADRIVAQLQGVVSDAVTDAIEQAAAQGARTAATELALTAPLSTATNTAAVEALARATVGNLERTHLQIVRQTLDVYRDSVEAGRVVTGTATRRQAAQLALDKFAHRGVTGFVDAAGRRWGLSSYAEMATRSASGQAMVQGSVDQYQADGRNFVIVSDAPQECSLCRKWEGKVLSLDGTGVGETYGGFKVAGTLREATSAGLFHPNCFPADVRVSGPAVSAADTRWYEGDLVVIHTASGNELPVTPNHPILTTEGWVAAGALHEGHQLVRHSSTERMHHVGPDDQQVPALIGEVADALRQSPTMVAMSVPASTEQFHGDGLGGDVDVVLADGLLEHRLDAAVTHPCGHRSFLVGGVRLPSLLGGGTGGETGLAVLRASRGVVSGGHLDSALGRTHGGPLPSLSFGARDVGATLDDPLRGRGLTDAVGGGELRLALARSVSGDEFGDVPESSTGTAVDLVPSLLEALAQRVVGDPETRGDLLDRLTSLSSTDRVVDVDRYAWSGHVYNLQTEGGWYAANGIVVHNCRHRVNVVVPGLTRRMTHTADPEGDKLRQEQRHLERKVREWKHVEAAALDDQARAKAKAKVRDWQSKLKGHVDDNGLKRLRAREQITSAR